MDLKNLFFSLLLLVPTTNLIGMELTTDKPTINETQPLLLENVLHEIAPENDILYYASLGDHNKVSDLLDQGADPNVSDDNSMTAMHYAAQYGYIDIVNTLLEHPKLIISDIAHGGKSPFLLAMRYNRDAVIKHILATCPINYSESLCYAAFNGLFDSVQLLLTYPIDVNVPVKNNIYPLFAATHGGHLNIMNLLIANGATIDCRAKNNASLLHCATAMGHTHVVQFLIKQGADVNVQDNKYKSTPLHTAATYGHIQIVKFFLQHDARINEKNNTGLTALHFATINEHKKVIRELLAHPTTDVTIQDNNGNKALDLAKTDDIKRLLIIHEKKKQRELVSEFQSDEECCVIQ